MVQWVVEVCGCVSEPESGPVGRVCVWVCELAREWSIGHQQSLQNLWPDGSLLSNRLHD